MQDQKLKGFTLFELLLTLLLISLTVSLVAPNLFSTFGSAGEKTTLKKLQTDIEALRLKAFLLESPVHILLKNEALHASFSDLEPLIAEYRYPGIHFTTPELNISPKGVITPSTLELSANKRLIPIDFNPWP